MTLLFERLAQVKSTNPYFSKDLQKAKKANKFIGQGSIASSTYKYLQGAGDLGNCGHYTSEDVIFVSSEGNRRGRISINRQELQLAIDARATFITDDEYNRERPYNIGERETAYFLKSNGYKDMGNGVWKYQEK